MHPSKVVSASGAVGRMTALGVLAGCLAMVPAAQGGPRWMLVYSRQVGNQLNANTRTIENHLFYEDGSKAAWVGVTNQYNPGFAIFGTTDVHGHNRLNPLDPGNCTYDIRIYDPSTPSQQSPIYVWQNPTRYPQFYSYITHWMRVSNDAAITTYPQNPAYDYDLVTGVNHADGFGAECTPVNWAEAPGAGSDQFELAGGGWASSQAQTFVVPSGINRIVSAMAFVVRGAGTQVTYRASIRQGGPTGPQVGPTTVSRSSWGEFREVAVSWGVNDVPVTPGQTYALYLDAPDGGGFNAYRTVNDNYPGGCLYNGTAQIANKDLLATVVGIGYGLAPPTIGRSPASFSRTVSQGQNLPSDTFSVQNTGGGTLSYTIGDNASWLSVNPVTGLSTGEADSVSILYGTAGLAVGTYNATITIVDSKATNNPQSIAVALTVQTPVIPGDTDGDRDVDVSDFGRFQACYSGPGIPQVDPACAKALLDADNDVDQDDFEIFQRCLTGANIPGSTTCAQEHVLSAAH